MKRNKKTDIKEDFGDNKSTKKHKIHHGDGRGEMADEGKNFGPGDINLDPKVDVEANPKKMSVGHGVNINDRFASYLFYFGHIITSYDSFTDKSKNIK